jgi:HEAT repeat protein
VDPASAELIDDLIDALQGSDPSVRHHARDALSLLDQKAVVALTRKFHTSQQADRERLVDLLAVLPVSPGGVVPVLVGRLLNDPAVEVRRRAARALATLGPAAGMALAALRQCQTDSDEGVRREAARAIEIIISTRDRR